MRAGSGQTRIGSESLIFRLGRKPVYGGCLLMTGVVSTLAAFTPAHFPQLLKVSRHRVLSNIMLKLDKLWIIIAFKCNPCSFDQRITIRGVFKGRVYNGGVVPPQYFSASPRFSSPPPLNHERTPGYHEKTFQSYKLIVF